MSSSMVMKRLAEQRYQDSDGSTQRSLAAEMQELKFRPEISVGTFFNTFRTKIL